MCGRYTLRTSGAKLAEAFGAEEDTPLFDVRYNVAPTQTMPVVRTSENGERRLALMRWGLVPSWAEDRSIGNKLLNARSEGIASKPAFRTAFRKKRCLVPADGFYEWEKIGKHKQPFFISMTDGRPFAFAGLWEFWHPEEEKLESFTIVTTEANDLMKPLHDRMPAILSPEDYGAWLTPEADLKALPALLHPYAGDDLQAYPVNPVVNSPKYDGPQCIEEVKGPQSGMLF